jgi:hypothetical protein
LPAAAAVCDRKFVSKVQRLLDVAEATEVVR